MKLNEIYNEDCLVTLDRMPGEFIDLTITSPPYNVDLGNNKYHKSPYDLYNDNKSHNDYINWLQNIFQKIYNKTKSGGRCVINIGDGKNGSIPTHSDIMQFMTKNIGWIPMSTIIWNKQTTGNRTSWGSWLSPSSPSFPTPFEYIMIFAKNDRKLQSVGETDLTKVEFIEWSISNWSFTPENKQSRFGHNAMFPEELPKRCMKMLSWVGSTIYDPFMGAGTTAVVCKKFNRNYIGSEISDNYCKISENRLSQILDIEE